MLTFEDTLELLLGWIGRSVSLWVNHADDSILYIVGKLTRGESLTVRFGEDVAATSEESFFFRLREGDCGFFLSPSDFIRADLDESNHYLTISLRGGIELALSSQAV
jgi:hypothetical protein